MADPKIPGRMIRRSTATDRGLARLNAEQLAIFFMIIPHLNSYGKLKGAPAYVKEEALPLVPWATLQVIEEALYAISRHTQVKWFRNKKDGLRYIHSLKFGDHQKLEAVKRGADLLPNYPGNKNPSMKSRTKSTASRRQSRGLVAPEVEVKVETEEEAAPRPQKAGAPASEVEDKVELKGKKRKENESQTPALRGGAFEAPPASDYLYPLFPGKIKGKDKARDKEVPEWVAATIRLLPPDKQRSIEGLYQDVRAGISKVSSVRSSMIECGIPSEHVESILFEFSTGQQ